MMDLTVAICMYNAERYIGETLECLAAQTRQDFKLLIINDCSTDGSLQVIEEHFRNTPRQFEVVNLPENGGLCAGRRYVEENATTRYILFVDADDCPMPELVETLYNKITSDDDLIAVGCHLKYIGPKGEALTGGIYIGETEKESFYRKAEAEKLIFMQPTAVYDRLAALSVGGHNVDGFPEGKPRYRDLCEDLDLWTRMSDLYREGKAIVVVPRVLCRYRKHPSAMSADSYGMILRMRHIKTNLKRRRRGLKEMSFIEFRASLSQKEDKALRREAKAADGLRNGYYTLRSGKYAKGMAMLINAFIANPSYFYNKFKHNILGRK